MARLKGKVIMITGAAGGQGEAEARLFVEEGAKVLMTDVAEDEGQSIADAIGGDIHFVKHDVSDEDDWRRSLGEAQTRFGGLDGLLNNAGIYKPKPLLETSAEDFDAHYHINQRGACLGIVLGAAAMKSRGGGSIVNISSIAGMRGFPGAAAYVATKWALRGVTKTAAAELGEHKIRVNAILPGFVDTDMLDENDAETNAQGKEQTPLKRFAQPRDIAQLAVFLLSDESAFITGADHVIDGGWTA